MLVYVIHGPANLLGLKGKLELTNLRLSRHALFTVFRDQQKNKKYIDAANSGGQIPSKPS